MWSYAQWTMERMCGLWVPRVKQKQQADRNLSLALLRDAQLHCLRYAVNTQRTTDSHDARHCLYDEPSLDDSAEDDIEPGNICTSDRYMATLHSLVKEHLRLALKDTRLLRAFIAADSVGGHDSPNHDLQCLDDAIAAAVTGIRGRVPDNTPTTIDVRLWRHLAINDYAVEQQLFKAYIRCQRFERPGGRNATHVRIQYEHEGNMVGGFACINYFFTHNGGRKFHMLANLDIINTACVDVTA